LCSAPCSFFSVFNVPPSLVHHAAQVTDGIVKGRRRAFRATFECNVQLPALTGGVFKNKRNSPAPVHGAALQELQPPTRVQVAGERQVFGLKRLSH
jgi:hypothetical protein